MSSNGVINTSALLEETVWPEASMLQDAEARYEVFLCNQRRDFKYGQGDVNIDPNRVASEDSLSFLSDVCSLSKPVSTTVSQTSTEAYYPVIKEDKKADNVPPQQGLFTNAARTEESAENCAESDGTTDTLFPMKLVERIQHLEEENAGFTKTLTQMSRDMQALQKKMNSIDIRLSLLDLEKQEADHQAEKAAVKDDAAIKNGTVDDDDDVDLFGSDEETEEDRRIKEERLKAYESKKAKKTQVIAKSSVVLDVKPWSDETDLKEMEINVRKIESAGLKWGAAKLVPLAYGIKKLQIIAIVEDDNCSIDWLQEQIEAIEDLVQSVDIAAFNKL